MIPLDQKYQSYLDGSKTMMIDGKKEKVKGYGYSCEIRLLGTMLQLNLTKSITTYRKSSKN